MPSPGGAALPSLPCLPSPALLLWDPPCATRSWDPGSRINEQIETDAGHGTDTFNEMPHAVLAVCVCVCVCVHFWDRGATMFLFFSSTSVMHTVISCPSNWRVLQAGWHRRETYRMSNNMAKIADARKTVEQLKLEVNIERMMVSELMMMMEPRSR